MAVCQNLVPLVNIKIAGKWMFIPLKLILIGFDPSPYVYNPINQLAINPMAHGNQSSQERLSGKR